MRRLGWKSLLSLLSLIVACPVNAFASPESRPSANALYQLQRVASGNASFVVSTDSGSFTARMKRVDRAGLSGFTVLDGRASRDPLAWDHVQRLDEVVTRSRGVGRFGALVMGLTCAGLGNALGAPSRRGGPFALLGMGLGWPLGSSLGRRYGERFRLADRNWYPTSDVDTTASDTIAAPPPGAIAQATTTFTASNDARLAYERIGGDRKLRVTGSFGEFVGYSALAGPEGLAQLRPAGRVIAPDVTPARITWDEIDRIETRGGSALQGALAGGAAFAAFGALLGAAAVSLVQSGVGAGEGAFIGAVYVAPVGIVLGALSGALARRWVVLYQRPAK